MPLLQPGSFMPFSFSFKGMMQFNRVLIES